MPQNHRHADDGSSTPHRFGDAFAQAPVGIAHTALNGKFQWLNDKFCEITGYSGAELMQKHFREITHPDDADADIAASKELLEGTLKHYSVEKRYIHKSGAVVWISMNVSLVRNKRGKPECFVAVISDITPRREAELKRDENGKQIASIIASAMDAIITLDEEQRITLFNAAAERLFGCSAAEAIGSKVARFIPARFRDAHAGHIRNFGGTHVTRRGMGTLGTIHGLRASGEEFPIEASISQVEIDGRKLFTVILRDITERIQAEETAKRLSSIVESSDDAILSKTLKGIVTSWNPAAERMFGYKAEEIVGKSILNIIPPDRQHEEQLILARIFAGEHIHHFETTRIRKDGRPVEVSVTISPIKDGNGKIVGASKIIRDVTSEQKSQRELALLNTCIAHLNDIVLVTEADPIDEPGPRIVFVNEAFERLTGYTKEETIGRNPRFLQGADTDRVTLDEIRRALAENKPVRKQIINYGKDGTEYWLDMDIVPVMDNKGRVTHFAAIERDITAQKRGEEALQESDERLRTVTHMAQVGLVMVDGEHRYQYANHAYTEILKLPPGEIVGRRVEEVLPDAYETQIRPRLERAFLGERVDYELAVPATPEWPGDKRYSVSYQPGKYRGRPVVVVVIVDITKRKRAEEQVAEQAALLDKTQDAILVHDVDERIQFWSKGAERLYGWSGTEAIDRKISSLIYGNNLSKFTQALNLVIEKGEWSGELPQLTKSGAKLIVEGRWTLLRDEEGGVKSILAINTDVTEKKKIEAQFMRAQRMESIGVLAGGVAHDLNNILAPIMMSIEILGDETLNPAKKDILKTIETSAQRGADIVRQILSFARGMEGQRVEVQPKHLVKDIEHIMRDTFPKNIRMESDIPTDVWTLLGDPTQLHQILLNLCVNARDAMPNGGVLSIKVENRQLDAQYAAMNLNAKPGSYVCFNVTDNGSGIPPDVIDKIFDPFFTTKEIGKGTGLGLSTALAIVKSHEGFLNVYSEPGKGTTFRICLPAIAATSAHEERVERPQLPRGNGETILIVDDEASILTITGQTLEAFGYHVLTASNGAQAVAIFAQHQQQVSLVLTDMMMPVMDGAATIHALQQINPTLKIIAASGLNANENVTKASTAGVKHFITKPYTAGALLKLLHTVLSEGLVPGL